MTVRRHSSRRSEASGNRIAAFATRAIVVLSALSLAGCAACGGDAAGSQGTAASIVAGPAMPAAATARSPSDGRIPWSR
jgi:hypothetical protein